MVLPMPSTAARDSGVCCITAFRLPHFPASISAIFSPTCRIPRLYKKRFNWYFFTLVYGGYQVFSGLLSHAVQFQKFFNGQLKNIRIRGQQTRIHQLPGQLLTQTVHVKSAFGSKMNDVFLELRRTSDIETPKRGFKPVGIFQQTTGWLANRRQDRFRASETRFHFRSVFR